MLNREIRPRDDTTFAILAGGASSRMGQDKALLPMRGEPLIQRVLERGRALTRHLLVITNRPEAYQFLQVPLSPDMVKIKGPLTGLYTALSLAQTPYVVLAGCDMPFINMALIAFQLQLLDQNGYDLVIPNHEDILEPLHAVYRRGVCLEAVKTALEKGERSLITWHDRICVREVEEKYLRRFDPELLCFMNLNTPQEYQGMLGLVAFP